MRGSVRRSPTCFAEVSGPAVHADPRAVVAARVVSELIVAFRARRRAPRSVVTRVAYDPVPERDFDRPTPTTRTTPIDRRRRLIWRPRARRRRVAAAEPPVGGVADDDVRGRGRRRLPPLVELPAAAGVEQPRDDETGYQSR